MINDADKPEIKFFDHINSHKESLYNKMKTRI